MAKLPKQPAVDKDGTSLNPEGRPHLSVSVIDAVLECGWAYYLKRVERVPVPESVRFAIGNAAHQTAEAFGRSKMKGEPLSKKDLRDLYVANLEKELKNGEYTDDVLAEFGTPAFARRGFQVQGLHMIDKFADQFAPKFEPVDVEIPFRVKLSGGFDLVGAIDYVRTEPNPDTPRPLRIVGDYKWSRSARGVDIRAWMGADVYALADAQANEGRIPDLLELMKFQRLKTMAHMKPERTTRDREALLEFLQIVDRVADIITNDRFQPNALGTWKCNYCDVREACGFYRDAQTERGSVVLPGVESPAEVLTVD